MNVHSFLVLSLQLTKQVKNYESNILGHHQHFVSSINVGFRHLSFLELRILPSARAKIFTVFFSNRLSVGICWNSFGYRYAIFKSKIHEVWTFRNFPFNGDFPADSYWRCVKGSTCNWKSDRGSSKIGLSVFIDLVVLEIVSIYFACQINLKWRKKKKLQIRDPHSSMRRWLWWTIMVSIMHQCLRLQTLQELHPRRFIFISKTNRISSTNYIWK